MVVGGGMRPNTETSRSSAGAGASTTMSIDSFCACPPMMQCLYDIEIENTHRAVRPVFLSFADIYHLCQSRSPSVPLYAVDGHPLTDFARASRRKVKIHIRIAFAIVSKKKFKSILSILEV